MSADPAAGLIAFASDAPLAYATGVFALASVAALAMGPGPRRCGVIAALGAVSLTVGAPAWGWGVGLALTFALLSARLGSTARAGDALGSTLLIGRVAHLGGRGASPRVRLDGRAWRARLEGATAAGDTCVRVVRIERDGRLVVRRTGG